eukprot:SAG25_NODE_2341_length_1698_cov_1.430894_1_plen_313_part_10
MNDMEAGVAAAGKPITNVQQRDYLDDDEERLPGVVVGARALKKKANQEKKKRKRNDQSDEHSLWAARWRRRAAAQQKPKLLYLLIAGQRISQPHDHTLRRRRSVVLLAAGGPGWAPIMLLLAGTDRLRRGGGGGRPSILMVASTPMVLLLAILFLGRPVEGSLQCSNASSFFTDRGMTQRDYTQFVDVETAADCCAHCAQNVSCNAWTYHPSHALCEIAPYATQVMGRDKISGYKTPPKPAPPLPPPTPPPPPLPPITPKPPLGVRPNIVLVLQDDMDLYMGGWDGRGTGTPGPMRQATELLVKQGAWATNWF